MNRADKMMVNGKHYRTVWAEGSVVKMINQPKLPHKFEIISLNTHKETADAISTMKVRGAGAIGATAGYAIAQAAIEAQTDNKESFLQYVQDAAETVRATRPTAQNLFYAVEKVLAAVQNASSPQEAKNAAVKTAQEIADEDAESCQKIGEHGEKLIKDNSKISTHCNAGWLAFVDWGSALSPIYAAKRAGKNVFVFVDETRPRCQGARLTAWELMQEKIPHAVIADNATGHYMKNREIDLVIVGADRIAANGDIANKIGTYSSAVVAKENGIPFYVASPLTTFDLKCESGEGIPLEERSEDEVKYMFGLDEKTGESGRVLITPKDSDAKNPSFDVTPAKYITGIITPKGIVKPSAEEIKKLFS